MFDALRDCKKGISDAVDHSDVKFSVTMGAQVITLRYVVRSAGGLLMPK